MIQQRLLSDPGSRRVSGPFDDVRNGIQRIRITEGCPNRCPYCHEPEEQVKYPVPPITRRKVQVLDMNITARSDAAEIIEHLGLQRVDGRVVEYELVCGVDYRYLTQQVADAMHAARFVRPRLAWDWSYSEQGFVKKAIWALKRAGYRPEDIMVFVLCNWKIPFQENLRKLDLLKVWNVKVGDCYFDGQVAPNIVPVHWTSQQITDFRKRARKHNQLVLFKIDPQDTIKIEEK